MRVIDHRQFIHKKKQRMLWRRLRPVLVALAVLLVLFVLANVAMAVLYRNKVLPNYSVATVPVGSVPFSQLDHKVSAGQLLPGSVMLRKDDTKQAVVPATIGVTVDWPATRKALMRQRWLPIFSLFGKHEAPATLTVDQAKLRSQLSALQTIFHQTALPKHIALAADNFVIAPAEHGYALDLSNLQLKLLDAISHGRNKLAVPVTVTTANEVSTSLDSDLAALQKKLDSKITLTFGGKSQPLSRNQIGRFYTLSGASQVLSATEMNRVIGEAAASLGVTPVNQDDAVYAAMYALTKAQPVTFVLADKTTTLYRYCTAVKGVDVAELSDLHQKLAATYGDPRGWGQGAAFSYSEAGCQLRVWLSAPSLMTGFGSICDDYYSCTVYPNVVINNDRWNGATDPWNAAGGNLEDYRSMVINHESGHWLGFGHRMCPGPGQLAPVMQQQSIDLQGCTFNPWPTPAEIASL